MPEPFRVAISGRPPSAPAGTTVFVLERAAVDRSAELAVIVRLVTDRRLFGEIYRGLAPEYFWSMPKGSGVFIQCLVPTAAVCPGASRPGDIDILVLPYEGDELVLEETLAIEVKVVRATYARQGKSPNDYGLSQARAMLDLGFPKVAVAHLIVSDSSPRSAWSEMMAVKILDDQGNCSSPGPVWIDALPLKLIERAFGRLSKAGTKDDEIGLVAAYVGRMGRQVEPSKPGTWTAEHRAAGTNPRLSRNLLASIADYFEAHPEWWLETPRFGSTNG
jgi:hypothetical protein